jgi:DNA-binding response OmpR family regulator
VTILVVEDEVLVRLMLADELREQGFEVYEAIDAKEAVLILTTIPVDTVVTDLHMRTFRGGIAVVDYVRDQRPGVSVILTCLEAPSIEEQSLFDTYFIKPFKPEDIAAWIKHHHTTTSPREDRTFA